MNEADELRRQLREAREECEEWRRIAMSKDALPELTRVDDPAIMGVWRASFSLIPSRIRLLAALMEHPGRAMSSEHLLGRMTAKEVCSNTLATGIVFARRALSREAGIDDAIECIWGLGYRIKPEAAARLTAFLQPELARAA